MQESYIPHSEEEAQEDEEMLLEDNKTIIVKFRVKGSLEMAQRFADFMNGETDEAPPAESFEILDTAVYREAAEQDLEERMEQKLDKLSEQLKAYKIPANAPLGENDPEHEE